MQYYRWAWQSDSWLRSRIHGSNIFCYSVFTIRCKNHSSYVIKNERSQYTRNKSKYSPFRLGECEYVQWKLSVLLLSKKLKCFVYLRDHLITLNTITTNSSWNISANQSSLTLTDSHWSSLILTGHHWSSLMLTDPHSSAPSDLLASSLSFHTGPLLTLRRPQTYWRHSSFSLSYFCFDTIFTSFQWHLLIPIVFVRQ